MGEIATVLSIASTAVSALGAISQGAAQSSAMKAQAAELERQRKAEETRALQEEAARREDLASNLSTITAVRAGLGLDKSSPTALAITADVTGDAMNDMFTARTGSILKQDSLRMGAAGYRSQASQARTAGFINAGTSLLNFGAKQAEKRGW